MYVLCYLNDTIAKFAEFLSSLIFLLFLVLVDFYCLYRVMCIQNDNA